jgi:hypothetical protein
VCVAATYACRVYICVCVCVCVYLCLCMSTVDRMCSLCSL